MKNINDENQILEPEPETGCIKLKYYNYEYPWLKWDGRKSKH